MCCMRGCCVPVCGRCREEAVPFDRWVQMGHRHRYRLSMQDPSPLLRMFHTQDICLRKVRLPRWCMSRRRVLPCPARLGEKIALLEVKIPPSKIKTLAALSYDRYDPSHVLAADQDYARVWLSDTGRRLTAIRSASPLAVIAVLPWMTARLPACTHHTMCYSSTPGLFVAKRAGDRLKKAAAAACPRARWLTASTAQFQSVTYSVSFPAAVRNSSSCRATPMGPNESQNNGPDLIISMAQYLSRIPANYVPEQFCAPDHGALCRRAGSRAFLHKHRKYSSPGCGFYHGRACGCEDWAIAPDGSTRRPALWNCCGIHAPESRRSRWGGLSAALLPES